MCQVRYTFPIVKQLKICFNNFKGDDIMRKMIDIEFGSSRYNGGLILAPVDDDTIRLMQVAVDTIYQGEGIGRELVKYAEKRAKEAGYTKIVMHAMLFVVDFYEKMGYHPEGDVFEEQGITFLKMVKNL